MKSRWIKTRDAVVRFVSENKWILIVMLVLLIERFYVMWRLGPLYSLDSDDASYVKSGIEFANSGAITMHGVLSAQIMPGMPVLIGLFSLIFGEGNVLWVALKIFWIFMGVLSAYYVYKSICIFTPKWCAILCSFCFFVIPNLAWMDNVILTETPFMLFFTMMIYSTLMMGKTGKRRYFWMCLVTYFLSFMMKANIGIYPVFAFLYLLLVKYNFKTLLKQGLIVAGVLVCFVVPWSIRNYIHYDAFIPLTYGAGNPMLLGTYQGNDYPLDEELDYETNVDQVVKEKYAKYFNESGTIDEPYIAKYISLEADGVKAKYRMQEWAKRNPRSMAIAYLYQKPLWMMTEAFYWKQVLCTPLPLVNVIRTFVFGCSILSFVLAVFRKKWWKELLFLAVLYLGNIYIYAMSFSFSRYSETLMPAPYIACGIGLFLLVDGFRSFVRKHSQKQVTALPETFEKVEPDIGTDA